MSPVLTAALLIVGLAVFAFTMLRRIAPLGALRREVRIDRMGERIRRLLAFGFGQKRLVDPEERVPGVLHVILLFIAGLMVTEMAFDGAQLVVALGRATRLLFSPPERVRAGGRRV